MAGESSLERGVAILSIRPEYAEAILDGSKLVEFRRVSFRRWITHALIYATAPVSRVVGAFSVKAVHRGSPDEIWEQFGEVGGISLRTFRSYYEGSSTAIAIEIAEVRQIQRLSFPQRLWSIAGAAELRLSPGLRRHNATAVVVSLARPELPDASGIPSTYFTNSRNSATGRSSSSFAAVYLVAL